jgi:hypothetical protein
MKKTNEEPNRNEGVDDFANFINDLENDEKNQNANCNLDGGECTSCGS